MNFGKAAGQVLQSVAPTIATAVLGPFGGMAVTALEKIFGVSPDATPDVKQAAVEAALTSGNPDALLALRKAEQDFQVQMKTLGIQEESLTFKDLDSARQMQIATKDPTAARLAWLLIGGFLVTAVAQVSAMLYFGAKMSEIPPAVWLQIGTITGYLANEAKQAAAFYFGSSAGSQAKDATISDMAKSP